MSTPFQMPDPAVLKEQLEQAQAARDQLDRIVGWLEEGMRIFTPAAPAAEIEPPKPKRAASAPPPRQPAPPRSVQAGARDRRAKVMHALLDAGRALSTREVAELTGIDYDLTGSALRALVEAGQVAAEGNSRARRYRALRVGEELEFHTEVRARTEATAQRNATQLTDAVSRVGLRDRVMKAILADPDALTEDRLAQALNAHRDDIADACGWLLERDRITLNPDGTYRRRGAAEVAA